MPESENSMATVVYRRLMTVEEFEKIPQDLRYNLIEGELVPMPPPAGPDLGALTSDLSFELSLFVRQHKLGQCYAAETGFVTQREPDTVQASDWAYLAKDRVPAGPSRGFGRVIPDAVLEVRSPNDRKAEVDLKMQRWMEAGVKIAWELDPKSRLLTVYRLDTEPRVIDIDGNIDGEDVLLGFSLPLRAVFEAR